MNKTVELQAGLPNICIANRQRQRENKSLICTTAAAALPKVQKAVRPPFLFAICLWHVANFFLQSCYNFLASQFPQGASFLNPISPTHLMDKGCDKRSLDQIGWSPQMKSRPPRRMNKTKWLSSNLMLCYGPYYTTPAIWGIWMFASCYSRRVQTHGCI